MKERTIYDDEFEKQLKEKADQLKMYPSDKVWNEVYSSLHTRRRNFVGGMSVLIGSILILAGSQLIFPSKNTTAKIIASKNNTSAKSSAGGSLRNYSANTLAPDRQDNSGSQQSAENILGGSIPFVLHQEVASERTAVQTDMTAVQPEKLQTVARTKPIQSVDPNTSGKPNITSAVPDLVESAVPSSSGIIVHSASEEMLPEKSGSQITHTRNDRFSWELYVAPTLNTHYLNGLNYQTMAQSMPNSPIMVVHFANVNGFVDNTPSMGYDVGGNILYRISKNISLKAGVDFSFNRYYIKVYNSSGSQASATLNSYLGYINDTAVNLNSGTGSGSINKNPEHYQNRYYQISIPVGVEMKLAGNSKVQLHMGATLQPSYLLNTDAYVLSDDFSSYVKNSQAFRRWNLIGGVEAYISYPIGKMRLELGPQVRYQIFSTYKNSYPLQENMLNYGIRIGISKSIR
jgi:hypothetical protein